MSLEQESFSLQEKPLLIVPTASLVYALQDAFKDSHTILVWSDFLASIYHQHHFGKSLLTTLQAQHVWIQILSKHDWFKDSHIEVHPEDYAEQAYQAWQFICDYEIPLHDSAWQMQTETQYMLQWCLSYLNLCQQQQWIDPCRIGEELRLELASHSFAEPQLSLVLYGFDELTPAQHNLLNTLSHNGYWTWEWRHHFNPPPNLTECHRRSTLSPEQELKEIAYRSLEWHQSHPNQRLGCVVINLRERREAVLEAWEQAAFRQKGSFNSENPIFELLMGQPLPQYPFIETALSALEIMDEQAPIAPLHTCLRSPFISGYTDEIEQRMHSLDYLYQLGTLEFRSAWLATLRLHPRKFSAKQWHHQYQKAYHYHLKNKTKAPRLEWSQRFSTQLKFFGWPNIEKMDEQQYQLLQTWEKGFDDWVKQDIFQKPIHFHEAFYSLKKHFQKISFQFKTSPASIKILSPIEASYLNFDEIWILGMDEHHWPTRGNPHPLLPLALQKKFNLPYCTPQREYEHAEQLLQRLQQRTPKIMACYALYDSDLPQAPSPQIIDWDEIAEPITFPQPEMITMEYWHEANGPALSNNILAKGGSSILKHQALCPFQGFAKHRLNAKPLALPHTGLSAAERGQWIHTALAQLWTVLETQKNLLECEQLTELIQQQVYHALETLEKKRGLKLEEPQRTLELHRTNGLIERWMAFEKQRPPFKVVAIEWRKEVSCGPIQLQIAIDRVDELENGQLIALDYKTGQITLADWLSERPGEPQLPLYAMTHQPMLQGIAFAMIRSDELSLKGICSDQIENAELETRLNSRTFGEYAWEELLNLWGSTLSQLSKDFFDGKAEVAPKNVQICLRCELQSLCRVYEEIEE